jgi:sugar phosphate isomerase/epimerase
MFKTAFSTVACPDWTLERVADAAGRYGFDGVELRTFGSGSTQFACDPALTASEKIRELFFAAGVQPAIIASSITFDDPITPPYIGRIFGDHERPVRLVKSAIGLAAALGSPYVRVFGFELPRRERRSAGIRRIVERLMLSVDAIRNSGVRLLLENGGSFPTARHMQEILERIPSPLLGTAYSIPVATAAGEDPEEGLARLASRLWVAKVKDIAADGTPCPLGDGVLPVMDFIQSLEERGFGGWLVYEWDRAWIRGLEDPDVILPEAARRIYQAVRLAPTERQQRRAVAV